MKRRNRKNAELTVEVFRKYTIKNDKILMGINRRFDDFESRMNDGFESIMTLLHTENLKLLKKMDDFLKHAEKNEQEIIFLGRQHDDLAKYCTEKIQYPVYGRNL